MLMIYIVNHMYHDDIYNRVSHNTICHVDAWVAMYDLPLYICIYRYTPI